MLFKNKQCPASSSHKIYISSTLKNNIKLGRFTVNVKGHEHSILFPGFVRQCVLVSPDNEHSYHPV